MCVVEVSPSGWKKDDLTLSQRGFQCHHCGEFNLQDANDARNLELWPGLSFPVTGHGDRVRPAKSAVA